MYDLFAQAFLALFVVAYLVFLAALAWWSLGRRFRLALKLGPARHVIGMTRKLGPPSWTQYVVPRESKQEQRC